jgi:ATP-dependent exoDNAse (exonuclease V) alpha subunit
MNNNPSSWLTWLKSWDFMAIFYSLVASFVFLIIIKWGGIYDKLYRKYKYAKAKKTYKKNIAEECGLLIVIGRRKGFKLEDVYVSLDTAPSDLMQCADNDTNEFSLQRQSCVLVGGPGAGKSTTVKEKLLKDLNRKNSLPVF